MSLSMLVIITGLPSTGKTTLGRKLSADLGIPYLYKDGIKERLFDTLGWQDREWSRRLGQATYDLMFYFLEIMLQTGAPLIVESNFKADLHSERFRNLLVQYGYFAVQILCWTEGEQLVERFKLRFDNNQRHPGHVDHQAWAELQLALRQGRQAPLDLRCPLIEVETTDFTQVDYPGILVALQACMHAQQPESSSTGGDLP
jgi:predicted kinase